MSTEPRGRRWRTYLVQRRINATVDRLRPHRWNWTLLVRPLDWSLARQSAEPLEFTQVRSLRFFWLNGLFSAISDNFFISFVALFALAYGATNGQIGLLTAVANLLGALSLFPGARLIERVGRYKPVVVWSTGGIGRSALLAMALFPFVISEPSVAIVAIIALEGLRTFMANLANPAWTALAAELVPEYIRGRFFGSRNMAMGVAALIVAPLAGSIIARGNVIAAGSNLENAELLGYQVVFLLAFAAGIVSTLSFQRIQEPPLVASTVQPHQSGDLRRAIRQSPGFLGLVVSGFVWNLALQTTGPFLNVYLVNDFGATTTLIGTLAAINSLSALVGQWVFGRLLDNKGGFWIQQWTGLLIPLIPFAWLLLTDARQVGIINTFSGFLWAGYNLANFNLLLLLTPDTQRPRAVALYQTAVFSSAVIGPLLGGYLTDLFNFKLVLTIGGIGRFLATLTFIRYTARPNSIISNR
jgi:MFS family permease